MSSSVVQTSVRLPKELHAKLKEIAKNENIALYTLIKDTLDTFEVPEKLEPHPKTIEFLLKKLPTRHTSITMTNKAYLNILKASAILEVPHSTLIIDHLYKRAFPQSL